MLKRLVVAGLCLLSLPAASAERLSCRHVVTEDGQPPAILDDAHADLSIDGATILTRVSVPISTKALTYKDCRPIADKTSNFAKWFERECRTVDSVDGSPYTVEANFTGSYAAYSRPLTSEDPMWKALSGISRDLGVAMPDRTFAVYANRHPVFEFFCYRDTKAGN